jgi:ATP-dependent DNA helicase DinG
MIAPLDFDSSDLEQRTSQFFSGSGPLSKAKNFEFRPQQQELSKAIARALVTRTHLVAEAGTGVGKSLAYLVPGILHALENDRKVVLSTHTINLQEQLFYKDLPLVQKLLPETFESVLLKGRQNYLCPRRLDRAIRNSGELFATSEVSELQRLWDWHLRTNDGTLSDLEPGPDPKVWAQVCSEPHVCTPKSCGQDPRCFYQQSRKKAQSAQVCVINHSLFFSYLVGQDDFAPDETGYLFTNDFVILDEAHTVENVAARHLGLNINQTNLRYLLHRLYHPRTQKGLLQVLRRGEMVKQVLSLLDHSDRFFEKIAAVIDFKKANEYRVLRADLVPDTLNAPLAILERDLKEAARDTQDEDWKADLLDASRRLSAIRLAIASFLTQSLEDHVYWVERSGRVNETLTLVAAPIDVAVPLRNLLFRPGNTAVLTSATLSVGRGLNYFTERVGAEEAEVLQVDSPFDYSRQMQVFIPRTMPEPAEGEKYEASLAAWIQHFVKQTHGKAFVLFTSFKTLKAMAEKLGPFCRKLGLQLLAQDGKMSRHQLLQEFKRDRDSVLFGTDSFWQGVDVPGEALSNVILTRLPFAVPDHPLIQARLERIEQLGGDPFREYSLPEAILKFRQGVGRLIRTQSDSGIIAILDNRVLTKSYGKSFLAVLPKCPVNIVDPL